MLEGRLEIIAGKGGVGRTTLATALAVVAARRGLSVLLCEIRGRDRASRMLGHAPIGDACRELRPGLWVCNVTPSASLEEYAVGVLRSRRVYRRLFGSAAIAGFVAGMPGLDDLMMIGKVRYHVEDERRWDRVIVDAPATGNGLFLLDLPARIAGTIHGGPLGYYAARQHALLTDARRTRVHVVTLAEEMPVIETIELVDALRGRLAAPLGAVVVNRWREPTLDARAAALLARLGDEACPPGLEGLLRAGRHAATRDALQARYVEMLRARVSLPMLRLPEGGPKPSVDAIADALDAQLHDRANERSA
jgi:anion-transporting  ArsA/GET3 family ATPase